MNFKDLINQFYEGELDSNIYTTTNEYGEDMIIEITNEWMKTTTLQKNGWSRIIYYYKDHTIEELYER